MKISTWNVNGIRAREAQVLDWIERERPDILCLQEIKASPADVPSRLGLSDYWSVWHGHKGYSGVALHLRKEAFAHRPVFAHPEFDSENRVVTVEIGDVVVASIYVPNGGKDYPAKVRFLESMDGWIAATHAAGKRLVLCGDFNIARGERDVHPKLRNPTQIGQSPEEQAILERMLARGLVDLGRRFDPDNDRLFTWWAPWRNQRERNIGWRLDYVLVSDDLAERATSCAAYREFGTSDHGPVSAVFDGPIAVMTAAPVESPPAPAPSPPAPAGQLSLFGGR